MVISLLDLLPDAGEDGSYNIRLSPEQFEQFKIAGHFNEVPIEATIDPGEIARFLRFFDLLSYN